SSVKSVLSRVRFARWERCSQRVRRALARTVLSGVTAQRVELNVAFSHEPLGAKLATLAKTMEARPRSPRNLYVVVKSDQLKTSPPAPPSQTACEVPLRRCQPTAEPMANRAENCVTGPVRRCPVNGTGAS